MATLGSAFTIANGALDAFQAALNIIANDTANVSTPGYTNEVPQWQANDPVTIGDTSYGTGVTMTGGESQRDLVLEQRIQQQNQLEQGSSARLTALDQLQSIFSASSSASSSNSSGDIGQSISGFFKALSNLQATPADSSLRQAVLSAAASLASAFQSASSQLSQERSSLDQQTGSTVSQVNSLTKAISQLNQQISATSPNGDAGELEDQRQYDLQQLSSLVGIHVTTNEDNSITVTTANGTALVSKNQSFALSTGASGGVTHVFDASGNDITSALAGGGGWLGGTLTVRDQDIPQMQSSLDTLAYTLASSLNTANEAGSDANGNPGKAIFNIPLTATGAASSISVAMTDPSGIAAAATGNGSSDDTNLTSMLQLQNQTQAGLDGDTPSTYYANFVSAVGNLVSQVSTENTVQQTSLSQLQTQRDSLSAVNMNDEAAALENLQQTYQSASKVFTILDTVMASAINLGVETTVA
jgi:flagellar hook-associated protein 1 FlgK